MERIAIHSVPRSGSTWLGSIFDSHPNVAYRYQPLFSYGHKGKLNPSSTKAEIVNFYQDILRTTDDFVLQKEAISMARVPSFLKDSCTHIAYKEVRYHNILENMLSQDGGLKIIGLVRNPLAVINSWLKAPKEFRSDLGWRIQDEWRFAQKKNQNKPEEFNGFEKWIEATLLFERLKNLYPNQFFLVRYLDLLTQTENAVKEIFAFCGLHFAQQTADFLKLAKQQKNEDAYSVFRSKKTDKRWEKELPQEIIDKIRNTVKKYNLNQHLV